MKDFSQSSTAKLPHSPLFSRLSLQRARCPCLSPGGSPAQLTCVSLRLLTWLPLPLTPISSHPLCNLSSKNLQQLYKRSLNSIAWQLARVLVAQLCLFETSWITPGKNIGVGCHSLLQGIVPTSQSSQWDWIPVFLIAGRFFTIWATREAQPENQVSPKAVKKEAEAPDTLNYLWGEESF